jgi:hypothetical protein
MVPVQVSGLGCRCSKSANKKSQLSVSKLNEMPSVVEVFKVVGGVFAFVPGIDHPFRSIDIVLACTESGL